MESLSSNCYSASVKGFSSFVLTGFLVTLMSNAQASAGEQSAGQPAASQPATGQVVTPEPNKVQLAEVQTKQAPPTTAPPVPLSPTTGQPTSPPVLLSPTTGQPTSPPVPLSPMTGQPISVPPGNGQLMTVQAVELRPGQQAPLLAAWESAYTPAKITVRAFQITVRRNGARFGKEDLYLVVEAGADDEAYPAFVLQMPKFSDQQLVCLGMNAQGSNLFAYDAVKAKGKAPPRNVHLRARVFSSEASLRQAAEMLESAAQSEGKALPALATAGPAAVLSAAIAGLGTAVVGNALRLLGKDDLLYEWHADLAANERGELGQPNSFTWSSDRFGSEAMTKDGYTLPPVRIDGGVKVE